MPNVIRWLSAVLLCAAASLACAQAWPGKSIRILVGYAPGGVTDIVARSVAQPLGDAFGQSVVVENRPGAAGVIATEFVAKSPADGYTLLMFVDGNSMMPAAIKGLQHDPVKSFAQVTLLGRGALAGIDRAALPLASVAAGPSGRSSIAHAVS